MPRAIRPETVYVKCSQDQNSVCELPFLLLVKDTFTVHPLMGGWQARLHLFVRILFIHCCHAFWHSGMHLEMQGMRLREQGED